MSISQKGKDSWKRTRLEVRSNRGDLLRKVKKYQMKNMIDKFRVNKMRMSGVGLLQVMHKYLSSLHYIIV